MPSERRKRRLYPRQLGRVARIEDAPSFLLVQVQTSCELRIADAGIADRQVNRCLECHGRRHTHCVFAPLRRRRHRDIPTIVNSRRNRPPPVHPPPPAGRPQKRLRYHTRIVKPDDPETFHDQVGYWLWEPATRAILLTLSIPRGQTAMAVGQATPDARSFTLAAVRGSLTNGIVSNPFLEQAFRTDRYTIKVDIHTDGTWSYEQDTLLIIPGQSEPFHHTDRNRLRKIAEPTPNPTARVARQTTG